MSWEYKTLDQLGEVSRGRSKHRPRNDPSLFGGKYPFSYTINIQHLLSLVKLLNPRRIHRNVCL